MSPRLSVHCSVKNPTSAVRYRCLVRHSGRSVHVVNRPALGLAPRGTLAGGPGWRVGSSLSSALLTWFLARPRARGSGEGTALRKGEEACVGLMLPQRASGPRSLACRASCFPDRRLQEFMGGTRLKWERIHPQCRRHEPWVQFLGREDALEKEMSTHSRILAWITPRTEEPGGLQSMWPQSQTHLSHWHLLFIFHVGGTGMGKLPILLKMKMIYFL